MCLTPIKINNSTRRFVRGLSRPVLTVSCGHCKECVQRMQDDWFVRCFFEFKRVEKSGSCWFPTLTFDRDHLPIWTDKDRGYSFPCFDTKLLKRFRDKLRVYMTREGFDASGIRYICCPEFGGKRGRSHYHMLIFVPFNISPSDMRRLCQKAWINGFVMWSKQGMRISSDRGTQYVMKYVSKPDHWYKKYGIAKYQDQLKEEIRKETDDDRKEQLRDHYRAFKRHCPRHVQSIYFGLSGIDYFKQSDGTWNMQRLVDGKINLYKEHITPDGKMKSQVYGMPEYYARKIFYYQDEWQLYQRNDLCHEVFALRWNLTVDRKKEKYLPYLSGYPRYLQHVSCVYTPEEAQNHYDVIQGSLDGRSIDDLILYDMVYRGIDFDTDLSGDLNSPWHKATDGLSRADALALLRDSAFDFMVDQRSIDRVPDPAPEKYTRLKQSKCEGFESLPAFAGFETLLSDIDSTEKLIGDACSLAWTEQRDRIQKLKEFQGMDHSYYV